MLSILASGRRVVLEAVVLIATSIIVYSILADVLSGAYLIHAIVVPDGFAKATQTGEGVATALRDEVGRLLREAQTGVAIKSTVPNASEPDLQVAGTSLPLRYVAGLARSLLRIPYANVSGQLSIASEDAARTREGCEGAPVPEEAATTGTGVHLVLQLDDATTGPYFDCVGPYPDMIRKGAWATLSIIDPFAKALMLSKTADAVQRQRALLIARGALAEAERDDIPAWIQRIFRLWPDRVPRAHLTLGDLYLDSENEVLAAEEFQRADAAYAARGDAGRGSSASQDGLSIIALNAMQRNRQDLRSGDFLSAESAACSSIALKPDYDSALYHVAQARDLLSRSRLLRLAPGDVCLAAEDSDAACDIYAGLLHASPNFAVAYDQQAVMMLQRLHELRTEGIDGCNRLDAPARAERASDLAVFIDESFVRAILIDGDRNYEPWLQRGILFYEMQVPSTYMPDLPATERITNLSQAIGLYLHAIAIQPQNAYSWQRLGESLAALADLTSGTDTTGVKTRAKASFCHALALAGESAPAQVGRSIADLDPAGQPCPASLPDRFLADWPRPILADPTFGPRWAGADCAALRKGAYRPHSPMDSGLNVRRSIPHDEAIRGADPITPERLCRGRFPTFRGPEITPRSTAPQPERSGSDDAAAGR